MRRLTLVAYDICNPARLRRVHKVVRDFGQPLQYSVFLCALSRQDAAVLEARLAEVIHHKADQIMFIDLGPEPRGPDPLPRGRFLGRPPDMAHEPLTF